MPAQAISAKVVPLAICALSLLSSSACSLIGGDSSVASTTFLKPSSEATFSNSGSTLVSFIAPEKPEAATILATNILSSDALFSGEHVGETMSVPSIMAPMIGYFPPTQAYVPADNEVWLEIDTSNNVVSIFRGAEVVEQMQGIGRVEVESGNYFIRHKETEPLWYAPDSYFAKRQLEIPEANDRTRFRRGALGEHVLYPLDELPIHSSEVWTEEVGGLKLDSTSLARLYYSLPIGSPVIVK